MSENKEKEEYILLRKIKFTVLEDFIIKIVKENNGCNDDTIAEILCLTKDNVADVINDEGIKEFIQGDQSRRTLISDFTGMKKYLNDTIKWQYCDKKSLELIKKLEEIKHTEIPKKYKKLKASNYYKSKLNN